ncbi:ABC transporter ATP-binding protein [Microvirga massiliensis]|uniref:ABC transporter ATP-binding protein n=1 Tax=Microvirga massiliensis TaxID=1033741 RepID=UPI00062B95C8|nr:ABC transporter ATP-binding protein [Microvirga massiliensis]
MILEARNLAIGYGSRVIGRGLNLKLTEGLVVALLGPNGGGKTTLLKTLLGILPPLGGEVLVQGQSLSAIPIRERARRIAYVPQVHAGTFAFTVEDVVLMGRSAHRSVLTGPSLKDRDIAHAAMIRLGIAHLASRPYTMISGGERQLALIARALAQEPRIVILDEPTASLDFGNQGKVMREIRALAEAGLAVAFSTHDPNHALRYADQAVLIRDGRCLASGNAREVLTRDRLGRLYGADVAEVRSELAHAFLPG